MEANLIPGKRRERLAHDHHSEKIMDVSAEARIGILRLLSDESLQKNIFIHPQLGENFETYADFSREVQDFFKVLDELFEPAHPYAPFLKEASPDIRRFYSHLKFEWAKISDENWKDEMKIFKLNVQGFISLLIRGLSQSVIEAEDDESAFTWLEGDDEPVKPDYSVN